MPKNLGEIAPAPAEDIEIPGMGIALQTLLNRQSQALHAPAHVRVSSGDPDPDAARYRDHRRLRASRTPFSVFSTMGHGTITPACSSEATAICVTARLGVVIITRLIEDADDITRKINELSG